MHEPAYAPGRAGFGTWPKHNWSWGLELAKRPDVQPLKIHKGKLVLLSQEAAAAADPLCREALARAEDGGLGPDAAAIVRELAASGPRAADDVRTATGLSAPAFRSAREKLEREGAVVARAAPETRDLDGHRQPATLTRWDQSLTQRRKVSAERALDELVLLGIRAAVVVQEDEPRTWFTWPVARDTIRRLRETGKLQSPAAGWVAAT